MEKTKEVIPTIGSVKDLDNHLQSLYVLEPYMVSLDTFEELYDRLYTVLKGCIERKDCRERMVKFKFYKNDKKVHELQFRHFIVNLIFWEPYVTVNEIKFLDENYIMDCNRIIVEEGYDLDDFINRIALTLRNFNVKETTVDKAISLVNRKIRNISIDFSIIMNLNFSYFTFIEMYEKYPRVKEIMESTFDDSMSTRDVEVKIEELMNEEISIYKNDPGNPIGVIFKAKTGIKNKQFAEFTIAQGLKPTIDGVIMPVVIQNSILIGGLNRPSYMYIDASAARKSLILNKTVMGNAGNFGKLCLQLARTLGLSKTVVDCRTKHYVHIKMSSRKILQKFDGRYRLEESTGQLVPINVKKDKDLVGEVVAIRSPVTCALGDKVCACCFGRTASLNYDIADGVAAFESEEITKELEQNVLSSKHLLTTTTEVLVFNKAFDKYFTLSAGEVYPQIEENDSADDIDKYAIYINPATITRSQDLDSDSSYNTFITGGIFYVVNLETNEMEEIKLENEGKEMYISDEIIEYMKKGKGYIKFKDLDDSVKIFEMNILNNELTKPLYEMMGLLNRGRKEGEPQTIDEVTQRFVELLVESKIQASALAGECIINRLVRSIEHKYDRPNFLREELEPYRIIHISKALEENASPGLGLSVQYLKRQLLSDELVTERKGTSYIDELLKSTVSNLYDIYGEDVFLKKDEKRKNHPLR